MVLLSVLSMIRHLICGELACELESIYETLDYQKWLVNFNAGKTQLFSFDRSNNTGSIDVKMDGPALE